MDPRVEAIRLKSEFENHFRVPMPNVENVRAISINGVKFHRWADLKRYSKYLFGYGDMTIYNLRFKDGYKEFFFKTYDDALYINVQGLAIKYLEDNPMRRVRIPDLLLQPV